MPQLADTSVHDYMLMDLDITHRVILVSQAALEVSFSAPKQRQLPEPAIAKAKHSSEKIQPEEHIVALEPRIPNCMLHFIRQFRG